MCTWKKPLQYFLISKMAVHTLLCLQYLWRTGISSCPAKPVSTLNIGSIRKRELDLLLLLKNIFITLFILCG